MEKAHYEFLIIIIIIIITVELGMLTSLGTVLFFDWLVSILKVLPFRMAYF